MKAAWAIILIALFGCEAETPPPDLVGRWKFQTTGDYDGYIRGSMKIGESPSGETSCEMTVFQSEFGSAREACVLTWQGTQLHISVSILSSSVPNWRTESYDVTLEGEALVGTVTKVASYPVVFTKRP
jgi:hypothetical protein